MALLCWGLGTLSPGLHVQVQGEFIKREFEETKYKRNSSEGDLGGVICQELIVIPKLCLVWEYNCGTKDSKSIDILLGREK